jgi:hypothetical protein
MPYDRYYEGLPLVAGVICPWCCHAYRPEDTFWIASDQPGPPGDASPGVRHRGFVADRFDVSGDAIDANGARCCRLACPECLREVPRTCYETPSFFVTVASAERTLAASLVAWLAWALRTSLSHHSFTDVEPAWNRSLHLLEQRMFLHPATDPPDHSACLQDGPQGAIASGSAGGLPGPQHPFLFRMEPRRGDGATRRCAAMAVSFDTCPVSGLYAEAPDTHSRHPRVAHTTVFVFDPSQDARFSADTAGLGMAREQAPQHGILQALAARAATHPGRDRSIAAVGRLVVVVVNADACGLLGKNAIVATDPPDRHDAFVQKEPHGAVAGVLAASSVMRQALQHRAPEIVTIAEQAWDSVSYLPWSLHGWCVGGGRLAPPSLSEAGDITAIILGFSDSIQRKDPLPSVTRSGSPFGIELERVKSTAARALRFANSDPVGAEWQAILAEYDACVTAVNARLVAAQELLHRGRRDDALRLASQDPSLIDCIAEIESVERSLGPRIRPLLTRSAVHDLLAAHDVHQSLRPLLREHRRLALAQASLESRGSVLRNMIALDPGCRGWQADLADYERSVKERLCDELRDLAAAAAHDVQSEQRKRAHEIVSELASAVWQEPIGGDQIQRLRRLSEAVAMAWATKEAAEIIREADVVDFEPNGPDGDAISKRWSEVKASVPAVLHVPNAMRIESLLARFARMRSRRSSIEEITDIARRRPVGSSRAMSVAEVERLHKLRELLEASDRMLGEDCDSLAARESVTRLLADARRVRAWRTARAVGCVAVLLCLVLGLTWRVEASRRWQRVLQESRMRMDEFLDVRGVAESKREWARMVAAEPRLGGTTLAATLDTRFRNAEEEASGGVADGMIRLEELGRMLDGPVAEALAEFREAVTSGMAMVCVADLRDAVEAAIRDVETGMGHVARELDEMESTLGADGVSLMSMQAQALRRSISDCRKTLASHVADAGARARTEFSEAMVQVQELPDATPHGLDHLRDLLASMERLAGAEQGRQRMQLAGEEARRSRLSRLTNVRADLDSSACKGLEAFVNDLVEHRDDIAEDVRGAAPEIDRVQRLLASYRSAQAWSAVAERWVEVREVTPSQAAEWRQYLNEAIASTPHPVGQRTLSSRLMQLNDHLERVVEGVPRELGELKSYLDAPIMKEGVQQSEWDGRLYYLPRDRQQGVFSDEFKVSPVRLDGEFLQPAAMLAAAHLRMIGVARQRVDAAMAGKESIDDAVLRCLDEMVASDEANPILRCRLIHALLGIAWRRPLFRYALPDIERVVEPIRNELGQQPAWVRSPDWTDSQKWIAARRRAEAVLPKKDALSRIREKYDEAVAAINRPTDFCRAVRLCGWADTSTVSPVVRTTERGFGDVSGRLFVVRETDGDTWRYLEVGRMVDGNTVLVDGAEFMLGEPVWLERTPTTPPTR